MSDESQVKESNIVMPETDMPDMDFAFKVTAGEALKEGETRASTDDIIVALKAVQDPELMLNVYELGLIYDIRREENGDVYILMTLTSPTCPMAGEMPGIVANAVSSVPGTGLITVELTFDPPWTTDRLSDDIKLMMGI